MKLEFFDSGFLGIIFFGKLKAVKQDIINFLDPPLLSIWNDGEKLLASSSGGFNDYSFVVFPFAKVYEGFLKKLFFQIGAIDENAYRNDRFRIGRALNPQLERDLKHDESVYDRIANFCGGTDLPEHLWKAWKRGRNQIFHFFPNEYRPLSFQEAREIVREIKGAMEMAFEECELRP